jgi:uncharacterized delta-60 repeat protein
VQGYDFAAASALALQPDGKLVAAGLSDNAEDSGFALARYNSDGSLDSNFGTGGKVTTAFRCLVPKVKGEKLRAAKKLVRRADCSVGKVRRASSATVKKGRVIAQKPTPGAKRHPHSKVKLKVSKGKKERR